MSVSKNSLDQKLIVQRYTRNVIALLNTFLLNRFTSSTPLLYPAGINRLLSNFSAHHHFLMLYESRFTLSGHNILGVDRCVIEKRTH